jgi:uncharacterized protein (DUF952 family)
MLFHVVKASNWEKYKQSGIYFSETFDTEKFIHLSEASQVKGVLERYYKNQDDLLILCINKEKLSAKLIYENATNDEYFPHLYDGLNINAIYKIITGSYQNLLETDL